MKSSFDSTMRGIMGLSAAGTVSATTASAPLATPATDRVTAQANTTITSKPITGAIVSQGSTPAVEDLINRDAFSGYQVKPQSVAAEGAAANKGQAEEKNDENLFMSIEKLLHVVAKWKPLLLSDIAEKKVEQLQQKNIEGHSLTYSLTYLFTHSLTYSLTHSLKALNSH